MEIPWKNPQWWEITIGIIIIIIGIALFFLFPKSKKEVNEYKKKQLEELNKKDRKKFYKDYEDAKLILPWSQRIKLVLWPIISLSFVLIGISMATGFMYSFFIR